MSALTIDLEVNIFILCRKSSPTTEQLQSILEKFGCVDVICDTSCCDEQGYWYPHDEMFGFELLNSFNKTSKTIAAWERLFKHLSLNLSEIRGPVWIVEDDVAGSAEAWEYLIKVTNDEMKSIEARIERKTGLEKWFFKITPNKTP